MSDKTYPVPYYKHLHHPRPAHSPKEEKILQEAGWKENRFEIPPQEYPKTLYSAAGDTRTAGKYPELGGPLDEDAARAEESALGEQGYSTKAVARKASAVERAPRLQISNQELADRAEDARESNGRMDAVEERMDNIDGTLAQIMELLTKQAEKPKRGRPPAIKPDEDEEKEI